MSYNDDLFGNENDMIRNRVEAAFAKAKKRVHVLLPDRCTVRPATDSGSYTIDADGVPSSNTPALRTWNGFTDIPCRADVVRSFRPDDLKAQPSQVDELDLHLPIDMTVEESDVVTLNGYTYKIRKLEDDTLFAFTHVAKIMRLGDTLD